MNKRISNRWFLSLLLAFAALGLSLCWVSTARAQTINLGAIGGTVYDQTGAVIPGATVVVHDNGTNLEQTVTTDATGSYKATSLTPAVYTVTITAKGFQTYRAEQVTVTVGSVTNVSPKLTVGGAAQTVTVSGAAPQVNTTSADFAHTLNQRAIANLPIQRPRWSNFALLTPGVVTNYDGFGLLSFRGMSGVVNVNTIDGANNVQAFFSEERGRTRASYSSTEVAIQEFQVNTSNYSAEYGGGAGGVINTVTKSGTNNFHGELFYKNRENGWASRNPFATITEQTAPGVYTPLPFKPKDQWNMWGFGIGGPIVKDKLFFFFAYDGFERLFPGTAVASSPSAFFAAPSSSSLTALAQVIYNLGSATPTAAQLAAAQTTYNNGLAGLLTNLGPVSGRTGKQSIFFPKVDWQITQKHRASFEVNRMRWASPYGVQTQVTNTYSNGSAFGNDYVADTWGVGKLDSFFTPKVSNEFRYQLGRDFEWESAPPPNAYEVNVLQKTSTSSTTYPSWVNYTNPFGVPTYVGITNGFNFGTAYYDLRPKYPDEHRNEFADTLTWARGNHTMKFGGTYNHVNDQIQHLYQQVGQYNYGSVLAYLEDLYAPICNTPGATTPCSSHYNSYAQSFGPLGFTFVTNDIGLFAQDDWKIRPRLSLSLGLRWEYQTLPAPIYPNPSVPGTTQYPDSKKSFGPRVGFAWDVFGNGKTAVRGGFGIYYGRIINGTIFSLLTSSGLVQNGVPAGQPGYSFISAAAGGPFFPEVLASQPTSAAKPSVMYLNPHYKNPQIDEVDFAVEHNVGWNTILSLSYLGSFGHFLPQTTDDNLISCANPPTCSTPQTITYKVSQGGPLQPPTWTTSLFNYRPNSSYNQMIDIFGVNSNYNALVLQATHRLSQSIQFNANYTWSHALDYNPLQGTTLGATSYNMFAPNNVGLEYGNSNNNVPNRFVVNMVLSSPWHVKGLLRYLADGWQLAPIFQAQTGLDYSVATSGTAPGSLGSGGGYNGSNGRFGIDVLSRNTLRMPSTQNLDLRLSKTIPIKEKVNLELLGEAFNLFNHFNQTGVQSTAYNRILTSGTITDTTGATQTCSSTAPCVSYNTPFGTSTSANSNFIFSTRQIQIGVRLKF